MDEDFVVLRLDTYLFNASVLGFIKVLDELKENENDDYFINANELRIKKEFLLNKNLSKGYFDACIKKYGTRTAIYKVKKYLAELNSLDEIEKEVEFNEKKKFICDKLTQASIKTAIFILQEEKIEVNILDNVDQFKKEKDFKLMKIYMENIIKDLNDKYIFDTLTFKSIMYSYIRIFWEGLAFLNTSNAKKNIIQTYDNSFTTPLLEELKDIKVKKKKCCNCDCETNNLSSMSFLNDVGIDVDRKKSAFWNQKSDLMICQLCKFVYSCLPLGFNSLGSDFVFVNDSQSIDALIRSNIVLSEKEEDEKTLRYKFYIEENLKVKKYEFRNIQVIVRNRSDNKDYYTIELIEKDTFKIFEECTKEFKNISETYCNINEKQNISVLKEVLRYVMQRKSLFDFIYKLLKANLDIDKIYNILTIEIVRKRIMEENFVKNDNLSHAYVLYDLGMKVKKEYANKEINKGSNLNKKEIDVLVENKLKTIIYKLTSFLRCNNINAFFDILLKLYVEINEDIPKIFISAMNDDLFREYGTAFVLGLKGVKKEGKDE